ncbi:hypothetical protein GCM10022261_17590 [Brevibacterium daeguense]|uniref:DUF4352 domain-containing protein n=1 Tax=Brevibacterium daeguense TaxID=909936 RepID=A0ABP8EJV6_9MICO|nr:DUF4190 domain-containing protein [Brevibacterium daeguense]
MSHPQPPYSHGPSQYPQYGFNGSGYSTGPIPTAPKNGFGIAALVLGLIGLALAFIPFLGLFFSIPLGIVGAILGILGLVRVSKGVANNQVMTVIGLVASALAIILSITSSVVTGILIGGGSDSSGASSSTTDDAVAFKQEPEDGDGGDEPASTPADDEAAEPSTDDEPEPVETEDEQRFSGQQDDDIVGDPGDTLEARGVTVAASELEERSGFLGEYLCSIVELENNSDERVSYNSLDWSLQYPDGNIQMATFSGEDDELSAGDLAPGGTTEGAVCFEHSSESGMYVLLFEGFLSFDNSRAAWINER